MLTNTTSFDGNDRQPYLIDCQLARLHEIAPEQRVTVGLLSLKLSGKKNALGGTMMLISDLKCSVEGCSEIWNSGIARLLHEIVACIRIVVVVVVFVVVVVVAITAPRLCLRAWT